MTKAKIVNVNHIAIAVNDIEEALGFWRDALGLELEHIEEMESQEVKIAFLPVENSEIEASIIMKDCLLRDLPGRIDSSLIADNTTVTSSAARIPAVHRFILAENSYVQL